MNNWTDAKSEAVLQANLDQSMIESKISAL